MGNRRLLFNEENGPGVNGSMSLVRIGMRRSEEPILKLSVAVFAMAPSSMGTSPVRIDVTAMRSM